MRRATWAATLMASATAAAASAQESPAFSTFGPIAEAHEQLVVGAQDEADKWHWVVGGYLQVISLDANMTVGDATVPVQLELSDLIEHVQMAFSAHVEGLRGPWGVGADFLYVRVGEDDVATRIPGVTASGNFRISNVDVFGIYRMGELNGNAGALDLLGGARRRGLALDLSAAGPSFGSRAPVALGFDVGWWDLLVGARWVKAFHPRVVGIFRADFGTDTWMVNGGIAINVVRRFDVMLQYRYQSFNHEQGEGSEFFRYDGSEQGVLVGFGFHF